jgi:hypothetical protein
MATKIDLPVKKIQSFLDVAVPWVRKAPEWKRGLEVAIQNIEGKLHVSLGGTAHYVEALLLHDASQIEQPLFLDLQYLTRYRFTEETMQVTLPENGKRDHRLQFRGQGVSFKVPFLDGENWKQHAQPLPNIDTLAGFAFPEEFMKRHGKHLMLPNSFGEIKDMPGAFRIDARQDGKVIMYSNDGFGAFCHTLDTAQAPIAINDCKEMKLLNDFFMPYQAIAKEAESVSFEIRQDKSQMFGYCTTDDFIQFCWVQPHHPRIIDDVPTQLAEDRRAAEWCLTFKTQEISSNATRVTSFYQDANYKENPITLSVVGNQYSLATTLSSSDMVVEGRSINEAPHSVRARFQAGCFIDYLNCLNKNHECSFEILRSSAVLYQQQEGANLVYWMPIQER